MELIYKLNSKLVIFVVQKIDTIVTHNVTMFIFLHQLTRK